MIYKLFRYTMTLLLALTVSGVLNSCINDDFVDADCSASEDRTVYLSINVKSDSDLALTRADGVPDANGMVDGDWPEHLTTDHIAIFFYEDGSLCAITTLGLPATHEDIGSDNPNQKEANYIATFRVTKEDKEKYEDNPNLLPKYCLVVLNSGRIKDKLEAYKNKANVDIQTILKEVWEADPNEIGFNDKGRFTMTNSVYVKDGKVHAAQEISPLKFYSTPDDAKRNPVTIYVERMVAKFTFEVSNGEMTRADGDDGIIITPKEGTAPLVFFDQLGNEKTLYKAWPWRVKVTGWGINAQEQNTYLFKNINPNATYFDEWNDPGNYRSYWCEDSHYDYGKDGDNSQVWTYPWQYRKAIDKEGLNSYEENTLNILKNYSYNDFAKAERFGKELYSPENTYDPSLYQEKNSAAYLDDRTSLLAGTHLLVCAEVQVSEDGGSSYFTPEHLYRDRQGIYYESKKQFFKMFVNTINNLLKSQKTMDFILYDWENGGLKEVSGESELTAKTENQNATYQLYYHPDEESYIPLTDEKIEELISDDMIEMIPAAIEYGDGRVLPWIKDNKLVIRANDDNHSELRIYTRDVIEDLYENGGTQFGYNIIEGKDVSEMIGDNYDNCIKSLLCEWFGPIDHFNGGKMYYAAPISHNGNSVTDEVDSDDEETEEVLGAYGVVRNCWYKFTLMGINRIGTPVDNPTEPIVPELINIKDVINSKTDMQIRLWHEEETVADIF